MTTGQKQEELEEWQKHDKRPHCKGKQTPRITYFGNASQLPHLLTEEKQKAANSLAMPSAARDDKPILLIGYREECVAAISKEVEDEIPVTSLPQRKPQVPTPTTTINHGMYECKDCEKAFTSPQALGGHRSSHEKVNINQIYPSSENLAPLMVVPLAEERPMPQSPILKKSDVHTCSTCNPQFPSGQALGGHKRCHYIASNCVASAVATIFEPISVAAPKLLIGSSCTVVTSMQPYTLTFPQLFNNLDQPLDLNLPPPIDDHLEISLRVGVPATMYVQPGSRRETKKTSRSWRQAWIGCKRNTSEDRKSKIRELGGGFSEI